MITSDSRYTTAVVQTTSGPDGVTRQEMRVAFPRARQISYTYYVTRGTERVDELAARYFGNGRLWWIIADANPEILNWFDLEPGTEVRIPSA